MTTPPVATFSLPESPRTGSTREWATATGSNPSDSMPGDLDALGRHVGHGARGRMFSLRLLTDSVRGFLAPRLVTVLVAVVILGGAVSLVL